MSYSQMNYLQEQYGGGGIPFSEIRKRNKRSTRRRKQRSSRRKSRRIRRKRVSKRSLRRKKKTLKRKSRKSRKKTKKHSKKQCKCGTHHYSSQEHTPRGLGHCEECIPLNVILKGKDGKYYRNETKGWIQI